jgi:hypothetical protein
LEKVADFAEEFGIVRLEGVGLTKVLDCFGEAVLLFAEQGEIGMEGGAILELYGATKAVFGVSVVPDACQSQAESVVIIGFVGGMGDRFEKQVGSRFVFGTLVFEAAEEIESDCVRGVFF